MAIEKSGKRIPITVKHHCTGDLFSFTVLFPDLPFRLQGTHHF